MATRPIATNNPFALIQTKPDAWLGLKGKLSNGFLVFDTPANGARAGFINLYNTYLKRGINTIQQIIPLYAPDSVQANGQNNYINFLRDTYNIPVDKKITSGDDILRLAKGIVHFEAGKLWLTDTDLRSWYNVARQKVDLPSIDGRLPNFIDSPLGGLGAAFFFDSVSREIMDKAKALKLTMAAIVTYILIEIGFKRRGFTSVKQFYDLAKLKQLRNPLDDAYNKVSSGFGYRNIFGAQQFHNGIDIPAPTGTPIYAPYSGQIKGNYYNGLGGNQLTLDSGVVTFGFAHLQNKSPYPVGTNIQKGQLLGYVGNTGKSTGSHLHFTVTVDGKKINPVTVFTDYK